MTRLLKIRTSIGWLCFLCMAACAVLGADQAALGNGSAKALSQVVSVEREVDVSLAGSNEWHPAKPNQPLHVGDRLRTGKLSRATVRLSDLSVLRVNELTTLQILAPEQKSKKPLLDLKSGSVYFFSREKPEDIQFRTPLATGAIRGTEFHVGVADNGDTVVTLLDGEVELGNEQSKVELRSGEQGRVIQGQAPVKTAIIDAINIIQWCLYYPAVLDVAELNLTPAEKEMFGSSMAAYRRGDLLQALADFPQDKSAASPQARLYWAALQLAVGQVDSAQAALAAWATPDPLAEALREMIAAVQFRTWTRRALPVLASEWLAHSYYQQSRYQLEAALKAARAALTRSPAFGFGWVRVAELEFSFGRTDQALEALERGLELSPRNPQGLALKGFFLSAQNRYPAALSWFDQAIAIDGALGNAWLGRGLCRLNLGQAEAGREDLQVAATLEPQRALLRSYLGKAFAHAGKTQLAEKELRLAKTLDPKDPTGWLYSALLNQQRNCINDAIADLEQSKHLNDNRRLFRSRLLLDQDMAVRSANLASIYRDAGMFDVSVREAARAVNYDYANYSAHLFLANSYDALSDPKQYHLRFETARLSERLLANLLAPANAGYLAQNSSLQDYSRWFEGNHFGIGSLTEYFSSGDWTQYGSQYGSYGGMTYALESRYLTQNGQRPNNDLERLNLAAQFRQQLTPHDSLYLAADYYEAHNGDVAQYFDQHQAHPSLRVSESQEPNLLAGYHRQWNPSAHTLFLFGRMEDTFALNDPSVPAFPFLYYRRGVPPQLITDPFFSEDYRCSFEVYSTELQQLWQTPSQAIIVGSRFQSGWADTTSDLFRSPFGPRILNQVESDVERVSFYGYHQWQIAEPLRLTTGLSYDRLIYPLNIDTPPITDQQARQDQVSPKVGLLYTPWKNGAFRGTYNRSLGALFSENSLRLEPTQIAGFNQAFRSLIPESASGLVPGTRFESGGIGFDQSFSTGTFLGIEGELLTSEGERLAGMITNSFTGIKIPNRPSNHQQSLDFEERSLLLTFNQLIAREWSTGARYRLSEADFTGRMVDLPADSLGVAQDENATLQQVNLFLAFNHSSGFFSQAESIWSTQNNQGYAPDRPGDNFWQHNFYLGYRFARRRAEVRLGLLNLTDQDYRLNPLNLYAELPRERTFTVSFKFIF